MPGCRSFPPSVVAAAADLWDNPPPGLVEDPGSQACLDLAGYSVSVSLRVQAHPVGMAARPLLPAAEAARAGGPPSPVDDRRRCRALSWAARCEATRQPARASARPARGHGA